MSEFEARITDFNSIIDRLNKLISSPPSGVGYKVEVLELTKVTGGKIPTLTEAEIETINHPFYNSPALRAYSQCRREFGWANEEHDPNRPAKSAVGILLEGFGRYIGLRQTSDLEQAVKIQKAFVYAFEAVLLVEYPESPLLSDIKDWMKSDADKFSKPIQELLN